MTLDEIIALGVEPCAAALLRTGPRSPRPLDYTNVSNDCAHLPRRPFECQLTLTARLVGDPPIAGSRPPGTMNAGRLLVHRRPRAVALRSPCGLHTHRARPAVRAHLVEPSRGAASLASAPRRERPADLDPESGAGGGRCRSGLETRAALVRHRARDAADHQTAHHSARPLHATRGRAARLGRYLGGRAPRRPDAHGRGGRGAHQRPGVAARCDPQCDRRCAYVRHRDLVPARGRTAHARAHDVGIRR